MAQAVERPKIIWQPSCFFYLIGAGIGDPDLLVDPHFGRRAEVTEGAVSSLPTAVRLHGKVGTWLAGAQLVLLHLGL